MPTLLLTVGQAQSSTPSRSGRAPVYQDYESADRGIRAAEARGCRVVDGLTMLVNQGVIGIKYWTGIDADVSVMRKALEDLISTD